MFGLGIDLGYSSVKLVLADEDGRILWSRYRMHKGYVSSCLSDLLGLLVDRLGPDCQLYGSVVGSGSSLISLSGCVFKTMDVQALVEGGNALSPGVRSIAEIGGQVCRYISGLGDEENLEVSMNSGCASGTGAFLEEQMSRLGMKIEDYDSIAQKARSVPRIAARCSVFAKSDIIHHQQEGVPVADILMGLAHGVAGSYKNGVIKGKKTSGPMLFCGGVSLNGTMVEALGKKLGKREEELLVPSGSEVVSALGAALIGIREGIPLDLWSLISWLKAGGQHEVEGGEPPMESLSSYGLGDAVGKHSIVASPDSSGCWLGIDVGSTSTDLVALNGSGQVVGFRYLKTLGDPVSSVKKGLSEIAHDLRGCPVLGVGVTGSGRGMIGKLVGADRVKDEITAQARGAVAMDPEVDTVFEIGGQDSKYISIYGGLVRDFQMNKVCAAGTGAFIEEQASKLGIPLDEFGDLALKGETPSDLGERCTVFMESSVASHLAKGVEIEDVASGLCHSVVRNYLHRVVGGGRVGKKIFLQGGIAYNQGVVNAFRAHLGASIEVPPFFSVTGAIGAALLVKDEMKREEGSSFKGFALSRLEDPIVLSQTYSEDQEKRSVVMDRFTSQVHRDLLGDLEEVRDPSRPTVGIPRALFCYGMYPMFAPFFRRLGMNVMLSDPSSENTVRLAQEYSLGETCFPVKLVNGHVAELVAKGVDYLFFPDLHSVYHPDSRSRQCYGCPYMQLAFKMVDKAMDLKGRGIGLLAPTIAFNLGKEFVMNSFVSMGRQLGASTEESRDALKFAMESYGRFSAKLERRAEENLEALDKSEETFVMLSKVYGIADPLLNMGVPEMLEDMGYRVLPFYGIPAEDIFDDHPNMYWPFGQHVLSAAKLIGRRKNLHGVFLSHHGCGPDTLTSHYLREILKEKPFLSIEVDEHSSSVGVRTRVEAFVNSVVNGTEHRIEGSSSYQVEPSRKEESCSIWIPPLEPYSSIMVAWAARQGIDLIAGSPLGSAAVERGREHALSGEYLSMSALLGGFLEDSDKLVDMKALIPQNEGAEVDGQFPRWLEAVLSVSSGDRPDIIAPFIEDLPTGDEAIFMGLARCLLAGDLVMAIPGEIRRGVVDELCSSIRSEGLGDDALFDLVETVVSYGKGGGRKRILAMGEPLILFSRGLNGGVLDFLERTADVLYGSMGEALWLLWHDLLDQPSRDERELLSDRLDWFRDLMKRLSSADPELVPFGIDLDGLASLANEHMGHYAGTFGRYRGAKPLSKGDFDGVVSLSSMYENTGISLGVIRRDSSLGDFPPCLDLVFDGTDTDDNLARLETFVHYLKPREVSERELSTCLVRS
ncbi:acyl-CoA dehydratase activase [Dethiosulfovibrio sp. F2B]|uniref:acyl-CoA dehydratase activase n=1 Tax=Dethiosulfovibrio faecalis TaxID=2720018 RepID=UPI001F379ABA|nr:acyl-CoA dehydratase activase [Dethiosulfovibrio faecalis]MCF4151216.1 acyl-CoA dehydratase activase [Dethiosulfovibrio faecalis]